MGLSLSLITLIGVWPVFGICTAITIFWFSIGFILWWRTKKSKPIMKNQQEREAIPISEIESSEKVRLSQSNV